MILQSDFLRSQVFFHRQRIIRAAFDRRIIGDDHHFLASHATNPRDHARRWHIVGIHIRRRQRPNFQPRRARIKQPLDAVAHKQLAAPFVPSASLSASAFVRQHRSFA